MDEVNRNRLEEFRQLRQEIRHSEEYLIVGMDIAKDRHYAFFGTATRKTLLKRIVFSNDMKGSENSWIRLRPCGYSMG
jgi:transposase